MESLATLLTMDRKNCESAKRLFRQYNLPIRWQSIGVEDLANKKKFQKKQVARTAKVYERWLW